MGRPRHVHRSNQNRAEDIAYHRHQCAAISKASQAATARRMTLALKCGRCARPRSIISLKLKSRRRGVTRGDGAAAFSAERKP